jgi:hypothetical protein
MAITANAVRWPVAGNRTLVSDFKPDVLVRFQIGRLCLISNRTLVSDLKPDTMVRFQIGRLCLVSNRTLVWFTGPFSYKGLMG